MGDIMVTPKYLLEVVEQFPDAAPELRDVNIAREAAYWKLRMMVDPFLAIGIVSEKKQAGRAAVAVGNKGDYAYKLRWMWKTNIGLHFHAVFIAIDEIEYDLTQGFEAVHFKGLLGGLSQRYLTMANYTL